ncbi:MAG: FtsX-like permease family protein, partial [Pirellulaceae bacterium]|nr:FtsX-like permease family protein [Pirellulaceae bacterium]
VDGAVHEEKFVIVGILETSGTPNDRAVFVNMEGFFLMGGHAKEPDPSSEEEEEPEEEEVAEVQVGGDGTSQRPPGLKDELREVTAILLRSAHPLFARGMFNTVNEGDEAQIVHPVGEIRNLFTFIVEPVQYLLLGLTVLICVVSGISILVSIYNSMSARKKEIAIMRAMGASRRSVTLVVLFESILLSVGGGLFGWFAAHLAIFFAGPIVEDKVGVVVKPWDFAPAMQAADFPTEGIMSWFGAILEFRINEVAIFSNISPEVLVIPGLILLAILVGILPAFAAYRTDVAESL